MIIPTTIEFKPNGKTTVFEFPRNKPAVLSTITVFPTLRKKALKCFPTSITQSGIQFEKAPPRGSAILVFYRTETT